MGKKLTKEIFIERSIEKHGNVFDYTKVIYKNTSSKVEIVCRKHGSFHQSPYNHMSGQKCPSCSGRPIYTTKTFIENSKKIHGDKYGYSKSEYISSKIKVIITCPKHGDFQQSPNTHFKGTGCKKCGDERRQKSLSHTNQEFIEKSIKIHDTKYDYSKVDYINTKTKVIIICPEHGEFTQSPDKHLIGQGCQRCSNHSVFDTPSFIEDSIKIHGDKYDYSKVNYIKSNLKVKIICSVHGVFEQRPGNHLNGQGCGVCGIINTGLNQRGNTEQFIIESKKIHGDHYDYSKVDYVKNNLKVKIICPTHGEFEQIPNGHLEGQGCTECGYEKVSRDLKLPYETFLIRSKLIHGMTYEYDKKTYTSYTEKMRIICKKHGEFLQTPHSHISMSTGCPKCDSSHGERLIRDLLTRKHILFEEQKTFEWLMDKSKLRCDFYLPKYNTVIEYNGIQHYEMIEYFGGESGFKRGQKRDTIKRKLLKENNVKLIEVRYDEKDVENFILNLL